MGDRGGCGGGVCLCVAVSLLRVGGGWGDVKGTHAQTRLSFGTRVAYSPLLFNCQGRGHRFGTTVPEHSQWDNLLLFCCPPP